MGNQFLHIENQSTTRYLNIPSSRFSIFPPNGFVLSETFKGLESPQFQGQIQFREIKGQSFKTKFEGFSSRLTREQNILKQESFTINDMEAGFICFQSEQALLAVSEEIIMVNMVLFLGNEQFLALITASYPHKWHKQLGPEVEKSLKSVIYDPMRSPIQPTYHEQVSFELNASTAGLRLADFNSQPKDIGLVHTLVFTPDGKDLATTDHIHRLIVMEKTWQGSPVMLEILPGFQNNFFSTFEHIDTQKVDIDGLEGYESWAIETANNSSEDRKLAYQLLLFDDERHFEIRAFAPDTEISRLKAFQKVSRTFRRR